MEKSWKSFNVGGWKTYVLKEKLKLLREKLREWNKTVFGYMDLNIDTVVKEINVLDDVVGMGDTQVGEKRKELTMHFWQQIHAKESLT